MAFEQVGLEAVLKGVGVYTANAGRIVSSNSAITKSLNVASASAAKFSKVASLAMKAGALAIAAGIAASILVFANFDAAMTESIAIMGDVSDAMRVDMEQAARDVAKVTTFSMKEAAESYFFLASAGLSAAQSIGAMPLVARFAQAGMFDMALATDLLTDAQSALGLVVDDTAQNIENMARVSDVLVKANTLANATVQQFSTALTREAGAAIKTFNKDLEEGVAVLAAFADQGVKGEVAGSSLSRILRLMGSAAVNNAEAYEQLNIEVFDSAGNMRNLADIIEDLEDALLGMDDATRIASLQTLGFQARVQGVILPLLGTSDKIREYEAGLRSAAGITEEVAEKQLRSLSAQFSLLRSAIEDVLFTVGKALEPALRNLVRILREDVIPWIEVRMPVALDKLETGFEDVRPVIVETAEAMDDLRVAVIAVGSWILANQARIVIAIVAIGAAFIWISPVTAALIGAGGLIFAIGLLRTSIEDLEPVLLRIRIKFAEFALGLAEDAQVIQGVATLGIIPLLEKVTDIEDSKITQAVDNIRANIEEMERVLDQKASRALADAEAAAASFDNTIEGLTDSLKDSTKASITVRDVLTGVVTVLPRATVEADLMAMSLDAIARAARESGEDVDQFLRKVVLFDQIAAATARLELAFVGGAVPGVIRSQLQILRELEDELGRLMVGVDAGAGDGGPSLGAVGDAVEDEVDRIAKIWLDGARQWMRAITQGVLEGSVTVLDALIFLEQGMVDAARSITNALADEADRQEEVASIIEAAVARGQAEIQDVRRLFEIGAVGTARDFLEALVGRPSSIAEAIADALLATRREQRRAFPTASFDHGGFVPAGQTVSALMHGPEVAIPLGQDSGALRFLAAAIQGMPGSKAGFQNFGSVNVFAGDDDDMRVMRSMTRALGAA